MLLENKVCSFYSPFFFYYRMLFVEKITAILRKTIGSSKQDSSFMKSSTLYTIMLNNFTAKQLSLDCQGK